MFFMFFMFFFEIKKIIKYIVYYFAQEDALIIKLNYPRVLIRTQLVFLTLVVLYDSKSALLLLVVKEDKDFYSDLFRFICLPNIHIPILVKKTLLITKHKLNKK